MLPELIVLEGLLYWLDGLVVDVQQRLHGTWRGVKERQPGQLGWLCKRAALTTLTDDTNCSCCM